MKFGQLHIFESAAGRPDKQIIDEQIELMVRAEELGFDSVWAAEHHFSEYGSCASPAVTLAAVAALTSRIRLGTAVTVLPLNHPLRVAEDYAFLDQLSGGRVDLGVGRGYQAPEFDGYGVNQADSREIFDECVEIIREAWTQPRCSHRGRFYNFDDVAVRPRPLQEPHPPIWMASLSPETFDTCGRHGFNLLCAPAFGFDLRAGAAQIGDYRAALRAHGTRPEDREVGALTITYVAEDSQQARAELRDSVIWYYRTLAKYIAPAGRPAVAGYESYTEARRFLETIDWDTALNYGAVVCGSPNEVAERIDEIARSCGVSTYLAWTRIGGLDKAKVTRSMELMAAKVIPQLS